MSEPIVVWIDGASRGNPGQAGIGVLIQNNEGETLNEISEYLGDDKTNNQAEYSALIKALESCKELGVKNVKVLSDSELVVKQMKNQYRVRSEKIKNLHKKAKRLESEFQEVAYNHVSREKNSIADNLANKAIDSENS